MLKLKLKKIHQLLVSEVPENDDCLPSTHSQALPIQININCQLPPLFSGQSTAPESPA